MLFEKKDDTFYCIWKMLMNLNMIKYFRFISADKASTLNPGIREIIITSLSKEKYSTTRRNELSLD